MAESHEFAFIDWVRQRAGNHPELALGIGDDAAVLHPSSRELLVAKDVLMEGTHFTFPEATPELAGRKALAVNLSDIAAMGGDPTVAFVGLCLPRQRGLEFARRVEQGIQELADEFGVTIAGGDTNIWDGPLVISVTLLGRVESGQAWLRSGAQPGDAVVVTGPLGGSFPSGRHLRFTPRLEYARWLRRQDSVTAMIDISDGLLRDLGHILDESHVGATLFADRIPIHADVSPQLPELQRLTQAVTDGEDFELLFTVSAGSLSLLQKLPPEWPWAHIGDIIFEKNLSIFDPTGVPLTFAKQGYEHHF